MGLKAPNEGMNECAEQMHVNGSQQLPQICKAYSAIAPPPLGGLFSTPVSVVPYEPPALTEVSGEPRLSNTFSTLS